MNTQKHNLDWKLLGEWALAIGLGMILLVVGIPMCQWIVLKERFQRADGWIPATITGLLLTLVGPFVYWDLVEGLVNGFVAALPPEGST